MIELFQNRPIFIYAYVGGNPLSNIDPLGLTQCDIDTARAIAAAADLQMSTGQPLLFPSSYGSANLGFTDQPKPRRITARTIPGFGTVLSDYYQQVLNNQQAAELLDTIIHEAVHYTLDINDPRQNDDVPTGFPYSEAKRLTSKSLIKALNAQRKSCACEK